MSLATQMAVSPGGRLITVIACVLGVGNLFLAIVAGSGVGGFDAEAALAALVIPLIVFSLVLGFPEAFGITHQKSGVRTPNILPLMSIMGLLILPGRAGLVAFTPALVIAGIAAAIALLLGVGLAGNRLPGGFLLSLAYWAAFGGGYGYAAATYADVRFDRSQPQIFQAEVVREYLSYGRHSTTPHLVLAPWGPVTGQTDAAVSQSAYQSLKVGDTACAALHAGALRMPWYRVDICGG
jgi:hypothetical protein